MKPLQGNLDFFLIRASRGPFLLKHKEMATHSSVLAWKIPGTEEPDLPQTMGLQKTQT